MTATTTCLTCGATLGEGDVAWMHTGGPRGDHEVLVHAECGGLAGGPVPAPRTPSPGAMEEERREAQGALDALRAQLAEVMRERDEARARVELLEKLRDFALNAVEADEVDELIGLSFQQRSDVGRQLQVLRDALAAYELTGKVPDCDALKGHAALRGEVKP